MLRRQKPIIPHGFFDYYKGSLIILGCIIIGKGMAFILKLILARIGVEYLGEVEVILNAVSILSGFCLLGFPYSVLRFVSRFHRKQEIEKGEDVLATALGFSLSLLLCVTIIGLWLPNWFFSVFQIKTQIQLSPLWIFSFVFSAIIIELIGHYLNAVNRTFAYGINSYIFLPALRLLGLGLVWILPLSIPIKIAIHLGFGFWASGILTILISKISPFNVLNRFLQASKKQLLLFTVSTSGSYLLFILFNSLDVWFLNRFTSLSVVGTYALLVSLVELVDLSIQPFLNRLPTFLSLASDHFDRGLELLVKAVRGFGGLAIITALGLFLAQDWLIPILFQGKVQIEPGLLSSLLGLKLLQSLLILPFRHLLDYYGHVRFTLGCMALAFIAKALVGWFFIPEFGLWGVVYMVGVAHGVHLFSCGAGTGFYYLQAKKHNLLIQPV